MTFIVPTPLTSTHAFLTGTQDNKSDAEDSTTVEPSAPITHTPVHVSFQSTSLCSISTISALNANSPFVVRKERGGGEHKCQWGIEMNHV
jgi:hypothetical protein